MNRERSDEAPAYEGLRVVDLSQGMAGPRCGMCLALNGADAIGRPIERITRTGLKTIDRELEFDIIVYATGFDAITGSFDRIDIRGQGGQKLKDKWKGGPSTFMGVMVDGFPNMFMVMGPHTALGNIPRSIEYNVEWIRDLFGYMDERRLRVADARREAVDEWTGFVKKKGRGPPRQRGRLLDDGRQHERRR